MQAGNVHWTVDQSLLFRSIFNELLLRVDIYSNKYIIKKQ